MLVPPQALLAQVVVVELAVAPAAVADMVGDEVEREADVRRGQPRRVEGEIGKLQRGAQRRIVVQRAVEDRLAVAGNANREIGRAFVDLDPISLGIDEKHGRFLVAG